ncbi:type II toxin-antitoxin system VapC family toxin [Tepidimonas taiwanensis]|uniref:Ribonuclease VapC22 n=1 Tax=Tepidimonas taiwanensis TaxID=307486 RepID=A0A554X2W5_9BURK|nr:type II toxin-antitoxin system VapC family toxin [Tepidimonas taiwanensis]TSE30168.1 Ribonuclease VapC22 [Tepidimonas taiwanensis]UBQ05534.1 type II toxin-antitoxin system VapC family toxin [Tepidimonas taiwanensis]
MAGSGVILDTHALLWMDRDDPALGAQARTLIEAAWRSGRVAVSAISFWEVAMLAERGRVVLPEPVTQWRHGWLQAGLEEVPVDGGIALLATQLRDSHRDSADRFIIATAMHRHATLVTADRLILDWPGGLSRQAADV